ncbi:MAG: 16S rRNA (cytidine(1402)-2'-O)-methyltransferase [Alicyclobacillaceae bacterium]|nr:16S rRNA (cytidine(1402)-2'-O)-methyltransferase [Alicyclobacillaceae bacterium]
MDSQFAFDGDRERGLVLVATPIGNLEDMSMRALRVLREADVILAEDTRRTRQLLAHFDIRGARLVSYHEHNRKQREPEILAWLREGRLVALVTDAGTPGISDPGEDLVRAARDEGLPVTVVPGPSAAVAALVVSGMPAHRFVFWGFLPRGGRERADALDRLAGFQETIVLYEAPHRIRQTVQDLVGKLGDRRVAAVRELTKCHEQVLRGTLHELAAWVEKEEPRGEWVLVIEGSQAPDAGGTLGDTRNADMQILCREVEKRIARGASVRDAVREIAVQYGVSRRALYQAYLRYPSPHD